MTCKNMVAFEETRDGPVEAVPLDLDEAANGLVGVHLDGVTLSNASGSHFTASGGPSVVSAIFYERALDPAKVKPSAKGRGFDSWRLPNIFPVLLYWYHMVLIIRPYEE